MKTPCHPHAYLQSAPNPTVIQNLLCMQVYVILSNIPMLEKMDNFKQNHWVLPSKLSNSEPIVEGRIALFEDAAQEVAIQGPGCHDRPFLGLPARPDHFQSCH